MLTSTFEWLRASFHRRCLGVLRSAPRQLHVTPINNTEGTHTHRSSLVSISRPLCEKMRVRPIGDT